MSMSVWSVTLIRSNSPMRGGEGRGRGAQGAATPVSCVASVTRLRRGVCDVGCDDIAAAGGETDHVAAGATPEAQHGALLVRER
jgi:hypothetical protein